MYVTSPCRGGWVPANHPLARQGTPGGGGNPKPAPGVFELRAAEGILLAADPAAFPAVTDGAPINATIGFRFDGTVDNSQPLFRATFPCLQAPLPGSPASGFYGAP